MRQPGLNHDASRGNKRRTRREPSAAIRTEHPTNESRTPETDHLGKRTARVGRISLASGSASRCARLGSGPTGHRAAAAGQTCRSSGARSAESQWETRQRGPVESSHPTDRPKATKSPKTRPNAPTGTLLGLSASRSALDHRTVWRQYVDGSAPEPTKAQPDADPATKQHPRTSTSGTPTNSGIYTTFRDLLWRHGLKVKARSVRSDGGRCCSST